MTSANPDLMACSDATEAETMREMRRIAQEELGYESVLEALEATPHAALQATSVDMGEVVEGVRDALDDAFHGKGDAGDLRSVLLAQKHILDALLAKIRSNGNAD
jgi:chaperonin GroEL (HSP60 family)